MGQVKKQYEKSLWYDIFEPQNEMIDDEYLYYEYNKRKIEEAINNTIPVL